MLLLLKWKETSIVLWVSQIASHARVKQRLEQLKQYKTTFWMFDLKKTRGWSKIDYLPSFLNTSEIDHYFSEKRRKNVKQQNVRGLKNEELKLYNHTI